MIDRKLFIFDLDGTLVETYGSIPLPGVVDRLADLVAKGQSIAVATNQAGVAWRIWTRKPHYPTAASLGQRFGGIAAQVPALEQAPWYIAIYDERVKLDEAAYGELSRELSAAAPSLRLIPSAEPDWRKPAPGMLLAACTSAQIDPTAAVFVGDMETDADAATAAGVAYIHPTAFFAAPTSQIENHLK